MTVTIPTDIAQSIADMARASGKTPEEILIETLHSHFPPISSELRAEFDAWEQASDEDLLRVDLLIDAETE